MNRRRPVEQRLTVPTPAAQLWRTLAGGACTCVGSAVTANRLCAAHALRWGGPGRRHELTGHIRTVAGDEHAGRLCWHVEFSDRLRRNRVQATIDLRLVAAPGGGTTICASGLVRTAGTLMPAQNLQELHAQLVSTVIEAMAARVEPATGAAPAPRADDRGWVRELSAVSSVLAVVAVITAIVWRRARR